MFECVQIVAFKANVCGFGIVGQLISLSAVIYFSSDATLSSTAEVQYSIHHSIIPLWSHLLRPGLIFIPAASTYLP